eukprot:2914231-Pyramimonas_sp.AAC.1
MQEQRRVLGHCAEQDQAPHSALGHGRRGLADYLGPPSDPHGRGGVAHRRGRDVPAEPATFLLGGAQLLLPRERPPGCRA